MDRSELGAGGQAVFVQGLQMEEATAQAECMAERWVYRAVSLQRYENSGLGCIVKQRGPTAASSSLVRGLVFGLFHINGASSCG